VTAKSIKNDQRRLSIAFGVVVIGVVGTLIVVGVRGGFSSSDSPSLSNAHAEQDVIDTCQDAAKRDLRDPDSARFDGWAASKSATPPAGAAYNPAAGDQYYVSGGTVNAKNGFGGFTGPESYACDAIVSDSKVRARVHPTVG
jgi:hypothetical protein